MEGLENDVGPQFGSDLSDIEGFTKEENVVSPIMPYAHDAGMVQLDLPDALCIIKEAFSPFWRSASTSGTKYHHGYPL